MFSCSTGRTSRRPVRIIYLFLLKAWIQRTLNQERGEKSSDISTGNGCLMGLTLLNLIYFINHNSPNCLLTWKTIYMPCIVNLCSYIILLIRIKKLKEHYRNQTVLRLFTTNLQCIRIATL